MQDLPVVLLGSHADTWTNHYHPGNTCHDWSGLDATPMAVISDDGWRHQNRWEWGKTLCPKEGNAGKEKEPN